jgi:hypothetical protein
MLPEMCGLWIGPSLSKIEQLCIRSFQDHGHKFVLYAYEDIANVPPGTEVRDANELIPKAESIPFVKRGNLAAFADWFRWDLLRTRGGYWIDMDMVCLAPFDFTEEVIFGYQQDNIPAQGVLRFPPNHPAVIELVNRSMDPNRFQPEDSGRRKIKKVIRRMMGNSRARIDWAEAGGPIGFRTIVGKFDLAKFGVPYTVFYPVHNTQFWSMFDTTFANDEKFFAATKAIHLWNEVGRRYFKWDKNATFHEDSLVERLKRRHGV